MKKIDPVIRRKKKRKINFTVKRLIFSRSITAAANGSQGFHLLALKMVCVQFPPNVQNPGALAIHCAAWLAKKYILYDIVVYYKKTSKYRNNQ
jgi:hypothetical protein